jgi:hypothetical protein
MANERSYAEHVKAAAICVDLALDGVERDIRTELDTSNDQVSEALRRLLAKLKERRSTLSNVADAANF